MSIRHPIAIFLCMVMAMALVWSKALLAISMGFLAINAAMDIQVQPFRIKWVLTPAVIKTTIRYKPFIWVFALFALVYIVSVVYAGNLKEWWALTHMKLDFLLMPLSFALLRPFTRKEYMLVSLSMIAMALWSSVLVQVFYFQDQYLFSESLGFGSSLPTPTNHIRYSVIIALSVVLCLSFAIENWTVKYKWERWIYGFLAAYFFFFLHILSVRSGLAICYAGVLILTVFYLRKLVWWKKLALVAIVIAAPIIAFKTMHGFEQKIRYTIYDFEQFMKGEGVQHSDSERWMSMKAGIDIGIKNPWFGTGTGNFRPSLEAYYRDVFQLEKYTRPHNQFINVFACLGIVGVVVLLFVLIYPMTFRLFWSPALIPTLYLMQLLPLMVEHPLDTALGTSMFMLFAMMGLSYQDGVQERKTVRQ